LRTQKNLGTKESLRFLFDCRLLLKRKINDTWTVVVLDILHETQVISTN